MLKILFTLIMIVIGLILWTIITYINFYEIIELNLDYDSINIES